jgi:hypothetical protein
MKRATVEDYRKLFIHKFRKKGQWKSMSGNITWSRGNVQYAWAFFTVRENTIILSWRGQQETVTQTIPTTTAWVNYGKRYYFQCPRCNMRAVILYLEQEFLCRKCCELTYESCQDSRSRHFAGLTGKRCRNFMRAAVYERELSKRKRVGKRMIERLMRYRQKSGVIFT